MNKNTPLMEFIEWLQNDPEAIGRWNTSDIVVFLEPYLKKEKQLIADAFDAGFIDATAILLKGTQSTKQEYLKQFNHE